MKYRYLADPQSVDDAGNFVKRPIVQIEIFGKQENAIALALIDSGADITSMNIQYAKKLGVELKEENRTEFVGISGTAPGYLAVVKLQVYQMPTPLIIPAAFIDNPNVHILLGQEGFFDAYDITFCKSENLIEVKESTPPRHCAANSDLTG